MGHRFAQKEVSIKVGTILRFQIKEKKNKQVKSLYTNRRFFIFEIFKQRQHSPQNDKYISKYSNLGIDSSFDLSSFGSPSMDTSKSFQWES